MTWTLDDLDLLDAERLGADLPAAPGKPRGVRIVAEDPPQDELSWITPGRLIVGALGLMAALGIGAAVVGGR